MFRIAPEGDELLMNMQSISKELAELMVMEEREQVANNNLQILPNVNYIQDNDGKTTCNKGLYPSNLNCEQTRTDVFLQSDGCSSGAIAKQMHVHQGQHQFKGHNGDRYYVHTNAVRCPPLLSTLGHVEHQGGQQISNRSLSSFVNGNENKTPKFEFHYLKPQNDTGKVTSMPLLSKSFRNDASARGSFDSFKKTNRFCPKNFTKSGLDYDKVIVDLATLGITLNGQESNPVLRLFSALRKLHIALGEVPPSIEQSSHSAYEAPFAPVSKIIMPCTMNVQYQVKYASRKLNSIFSALVHLVGNNRRYEQELSAELERYLFRLQPLVNQFEVYKRLELEHKKGQFITDDIRVHAHRLEMLLNAITQMLRDVHMRVIAYDWYIGIKYEGKHIKRVDGYLKQHSTLGVVNDILQMCNTTKLENSDILEKTDAAISTGDVMNVVATKIADPNKTFNNINNGQQPIKKATKIVGKTAIISRQPVFYIG